MAMILKSLILVVLAVGFSDELALTPSSQTVLRDVGENVVFTCRNTDTASNVIPTWTDTNGVEIRPLDGGGSQDMHVVIDTSRKLSQLNIFNIRESYDGIYGCRVGQDSDSRRLTVIEEAEFPLKCPTETDCEPMYEDEQELILHEASRIECTITGNPEPTLTWTFKNQPINLNDPRYTLSKVQNGKQIEHILAISNVTRFDEGIYRCQASQLDAGVFKVLVITVDVQEKPKIVLPPQDKNGTEGGSITFYCRAEGDPQPVYSWFRGGGDPLEHGEKYELADLNRELKIKDLVKNDLGEYTCQAENAAGIDQEAGFLNVFIPPLLNPANNETKRLNQDIDLECFLRRGEEDTWLRWRRDDKWLKEGKQDFNERWEVFSRSEGSSTVKVLRIIGITKEDEGPYMCWGENAGGEDEVNHWLLVEYTPVIDLERTPYNVKGWIDNESNMTCYWDGYPTPNVRWTKNGIPLKDGVNATIETEVVIGGVITILYVTPTSLDFGPYECIARNRLGESSHRITFEQVFAPDKPTNIRVTDISSTTFTIELTDPEDNGGLRIEGYQVGYHIQGFPEDYQDFNETEKIKVLGLTPEREYLYRVAALNDVGVGEFSENKTVRTRDYSAPDSPVILSGSNDGLGDKYTLRWKEADDNGGSIVTSFYIHYSEISNKEQDELGPDPIEVKVDKSAVAYTLRELKAGMFYRIELTSENTFGRSDPDSINIVMPGGAPHVPTTKYPDSPNGTVPPSDPILPSKMTPASDPKLPSMATPTIKQPSNKLPQISDNIPTAALVGIILGAFFILLILVDISCYFMNSCGFLMCICVHCCGKVPPDEKDDLEIGDGPPGYGKDLDRGNGGMTDAALPLRNNSDDDDSIVKPPMNGFSDGDVEEVRGVDEFEVKLKALDDDYFGSQC